MRGFLSIFALVFGISNFVYHALGVVGAIASPPMHVWAIFVIYDALILILAVCLLDHEIPGGSHG